MIDAKGRILDGLHRLEAIKLSGVTVEMPVIRLKKSAGSDIEGGIYVPVGPTPDYLISRELRTVLIGATRQGMREATADEIRDTARRAMNEFFGN